LNPKNFSGPSWRHTIINDKNFNLGRGSPYILAFTYG